MYSAAVLDRVRNPRRVGSLSGGVGVVGTGEAGTLEAGTLVRIQVRVTGARIEDARFRVFGCSAAIASAALVTEWLEGADVDVVAAITPPRITESLALPDDRQHVAVLAAEAARLSVAAALEQQEGSHD
jgi:nitrogen fixation NifU-like protein